MLSIDAHAQAALGTLPPGVTLPDLGLPKLQAAKTALLRDCSPAASLLRRRGAATLAAASAFSGAPEVSGDLDNAWRGLIDDPDLAKAVSDSLTPKWTEDSDVTKTEANIFNMLGKMSEALDCDIQAKPVFSATLSKENEVQFAIIFKVRKPIAWISERLDPQTWDTRNPFFEQSFYTTELPDRRPSCGAGPIAPPPENDQQPIGGTYKARLFEQFNCPACPSQMQNILTVMTRTRTAGAGRAGVNPCDDQNTPAKEQPEFQVCYWLDPKSKAQCGDPPHGSFACPRNALYGCAGKPPTHVDLITDSGDLTVCPSAASGYAEVVSRKTIKFDKRELNVATWWLLESAEREATRNFVDMVCNQ